MGNLEPGWSINGVVIPTLFTLFYAALLVAMFSRGVDRPVLVSTWARAHGLRLTDRTRPFARWYVQLTAVLRIVGGASGVVIGAAFDDAFGLDSSSLFGFWAWVIAGWMLGAVWAERRLPRPGTPGSASVVPRRTADYLPLGLRVAPVAAVSFTGLVAVVGVLGSASPWPSALRPPSTDRTFVVAALVAIGFSAVVVVLQRSIVGRSQPLMDPDVAAVDDAIRSSTLHQVSGAGTAVVICIAGELISLQVQAVGQLPFGMRGWLPLVPLVVMMLAWRLWSFLPWRVRRSIAVEAP